MIPLAHAGHWVLYALPVAIVLIAVVLTAVRERRQREAEVRRRPPRDPAP